MLPVGGSIAAAETLSPPEEGGKTAAQTLAAAVVGLRSGDPKKVAAAAVRLGKLGPAAVPRLKSLYYRGRWWARRAALRALGQSRSKDLGNWLFAVSINEPLQGIRRDAADALRRLEGRKAAAARYVYALTPPKKNRPRLPQTAPPNRLGTLTKLGRVRAVDLLARLGGPLAAATLTRLLATPTMDTDTVAAACEALGALGNLDNAKILVAFIGKERALPKERARELLPAARDALEHLTGKRFGFNLLKWQDWLDHRSENKTATKEVSPGEKAAAEYAPRFAEPYKAPPLKSAVDFVIVYDTTGSFIHNWPLLTPALEAVLRELTVRTPSPRLGAVRYRAADPRLSKTYLIQPLPLSRDLTHRRNEIIESLFGGGSGGLHLGLKYAVESFTWRAGARRVVWIIGDVTPRGDGLQRCLNIIREARAVDGILFNTLYIRTLHGEEHRKTYALLARAGGGRFYEYDKAWKHLVEKFAPNIDPRSAEQPDKTLTKLLTPKDWSKIQPRRKR